MPQLQLPEYPKVPKDLDHWTANMLREGIDGQLDHIDAVYFDKNGLYVLGRSGILVQKGHIFQIPKQGGRAYEQSRCVVPNLIERAILERFPFATAPMKSIDERINHWAEYLGAVGTAKVMNKKGEFPQGFYQSTPLRVQEAS